VTTDRAEHLFQAAREERPGPEARQRALELAHRAASAPRAHALRRTAGALALAASFAGLLWSLRPGVGGGGSVPIEAEPMREAPARTNRADPPAAPVLDADQHLEPESSATASVVPRAEPEKKAVVAPTLADEIALLEQARAALAGGASERALRILNRHARFPGARLLGEATLLRIEALQATGRTVESAALAREFVEKNPTSPLVDRARSFIPENPTEGPAPSDRGVSP
jgi:hypothetical protein